MFLREIIAVLALSSPEPEVEIDEAALETIGDETIEVIERIPPGAESVVPGELLERTEQDDIHKILATVAGVYVRDEDGYGALVALAQRNLKRRIAYAQQQPRITRK